ncbi:MAG: AAA-like domain-containing protein [Polyangiales bacterium]
MTVPEPPIFQEGLELAAGAFYLPREADTELPKRLLRGEFCAVLAPRQTGKSSLRARTERALQDAGVRTFSVDLSSLGIDSVEDGDDVRSMWYFTVATRISEVASLGGELEAVWSRESLSAHERFRAFLREQVACRDTPTVVFLDEIDRTLSLPFERDDFFGLIREVSNGRATQEAWSTLTFCVLGVATPGELVRDPRRAGTLVTGSVVTLDDFSRAELAPLAEGLATLPGKPDAYLDAVYEWTQGHPSMTQRLCHALVTRRPNAADETSAVKELVERIYLANGLVEDTILRETDLRFAHGSGAITEDQRDRLLELYERVLTAKDGIEVVTANDDHFALRISGVVSFRDGRLRPRNAIFASVLGQAWIARQLRDRPYLSRAQKWADTEQEDWLLRGPELRELSEWASKREDLLLVERQYLSAAQSAEARRNRLRIAAIAGVSLALAVALLVMVALYRKASTAQRETAAALMRVRGNEVTERARAILLRFDSNVPGEVLVASADALVVWEKAKREGLTVGSELDQTITSAGARLERGLPLLGHTGPVRAANFSPDGQRVVTASYDQSARVWEAGSGRLLVTLSGHTGPVNAASFSPDGQRVVTASGDGTAHIWPLDADERFRHACRLIRPWTVWDERADLRRACASAFSPSTSHGP